VASNRSSPCSSRSSFLVPLIVPVLDPDASRQCSRHALAWGVGALFGSLVVWLRCLVVRDEVGTDSPR
jgi:hypothetical protein